MTGMAGAVDPRLLKNQPGTQQFGVAGAGTGTGGTLGAMGAGMQPPGQGVNTGIGGGLGTTGAGTGVPATTGVGFPQPGQIPPTQPGTGTGSNTGNSGVTPQYSCKDGICGARLADGTYVSYNTKTGAGAMVKPDGSIVTGTYHPTTDTTTSTGSPTTTGGDNVAPPTQPAQKPL